MVITFGSFAGIGSSPSRGGSFPMPHRARQGAWGFRIDFILPLGFTREPPFTWIVRMCSYHHYSRIAGGFRAFSAETRLGRNKSRLVEVTSFPETGRPTRRPG